MAKECVELDLVVVWDPDTKIMRIGCKTTTKKPYAMEECESFTPKEDVELAQLVADIASARGEAFS